MAVRQWRVNGRPVSPIQNFGAFCCASLANPMFPGPAYMVRGFNGLLPAGEQRNWVEVFVNPYSFANSGGIPTAQANGFSFALRFTLRPAAAPTVRSAISASAFGAFNTIAPGTWVAAPPSFTVAGLQHAVALFPDNTTYVLPRNAIAGVNSRPARPGETITLYGIGFGAVTPAVAPGQIATQLNTLASAPVIRFAGTPATVSYAGLTPNFVGLYQFNVTVPAIAASDAVPLTVTVNGANLPQRRP